jgi:hydroxymethylpyrimidine kinase/phosphomethylpyrimidine kinase
VTPNIPEAEVLARLTITTDEHIREAARRIHALGPQLVMIKGGHLGGPPVDLVYDGATFLPIEGERIDTKHTHGTGCTLSAAITALLARGVEPIESIRLGKRFVEAGLRNAVAIGEGQSPLNHATPLPPELIDKFAAAV